MKILIAVPCMSTVPIEFCASITNLIKIGECGTAFHSGSLVYDARNILAKAAVDGGYDYVLWIDSDMFFDQMTLAKLIRDGEGKDIITGIYFKRVPPYSPCLYKKDMDRMVIYEDFPEEGIFEVDGAGLGMCLMKTEVLAELFDGENAPFDIVDGYGEDLSFFIKAQAHGHKIYATNNVKPKHIGTLYAGEEHWRQYAQRSSQTDN